MLIVIIVLSIALIALSVLFGIMLYHQMLLTNSINQRLIVMTKDAIDRVNTQNDEVLATQEELFRVRSELSGGSPANSKAEIPDIDEPFDPHGFDIGGLEDSK